MKRIVDAYSRAYQEHGDSPHAVLWPKGRQKERFDALTAAIGKTHFTVLDFGCGLAHLKEYLTARFDDFEYTGADLVPEFISANRQKHPDADFIEIESASDIRENYDYVVLSGVFNLLYFENSEQHWQSVQRTLRQLFARTEIMLAVNFMTDQVDYVQPGAFHQNPGEILKFASENLSARLTLDQSYMPYEFTLSVFKDSEILKPDNLYRELDSCK